tara:strand:- start:412 stop:528 length:117 start_codon:yes stop_codon:yes gene_type:complete
MEQIANPPLEKREGCRLLKAGADRADDEKLNSGIGSRY